ncbi:CHIP protein (carboxyl terminus of Hsc70-interacting protein) [Apiospora aurea]|uniref:CHIP protein (Carboxyl terminus of Hsc70-interacting protein) n=1 Tax=Apiospora aurea TaxID=335848 RepID=A0ABR1QIE7_9PEZI
MARDTVKAGLLKTDGNKRFQDGDFVGAESLYSKAIIADDTNPALYTNRAMARLKLGLWDSVIADCQACLKLNDESMKAHYYLAQAYLELRAFDDAVTHANRAREICAHTNDKSLTQVTTLVLRCKKDRWEDSEKKRKRAHKELEEDVLTMMRREKADVTESISDDGDRRQVAEEWDDKMAQLSRVFEAARANEDKRREVPEWAIDDITFAFMIDPVITVSGQTYERASIMEHLRCSTTDPLTREPLQPSDLRPNLALRKACEEFLDQNGWAVDW